MAAGKSRLLQQKLSLSGVGADEELELDGVGVVLKDELEDDDDEDGVGVVEDTRVESGRVKGVGVLVGRATRGSPLGPSRGVYVDMTQSEEILVKRT
jgi:hypothetical protein